MRPAGTAILRDVLVANVRQEVGVVDVVPDPGLGDVVDWSQGFSDIGFEIRGEGKVVWLLGVYESGAYVAEKGSCCKVLH